MRESAGFRRDRDAATGAAVPRFVQSAVPGIAWPGIPDALDARVFALQYQLRESQWWPAERLLEHQLRQVRALIAHAVTTVPFYRNRFPGGCCAPECYEDFRRLPVLTRQQLQEAGARIATAALPAGHGPANPIETSGSTGRPVRLQETLVSRAMLKALNQRLALWHRLDHSARLVSIRRQPPDPASERVLGWGNGYTSGPLVFIDVAAPVDQIFERIAREQAPYVAVYPTLARELARLAGERGVRLPRLERILSFGEALDPAVREDCARFLGAPVLDAYSAIDAGVLAIQCPTGEHYHVAAESALLEVLDDAGRPCAPGEIGRVVVTPLHNLATPLIRYDIGDYAEAGAACACGRGLPVLKRILGRTRNMLVLPDGRRRWPFVGRMEFAEDGMVRQIQLAQTGIREITLRVASASPLATEQRRRLTTATLQALGHPFEIRVVEVGRIERNQGGKYEDFVCELDAPVSPARSEAPVSGPGERRAAGEQPGAEPQYRLRIDERWSVWRDVVLRSTGFPVALLDRLACPDSGRAADALLAADERLEAALVAAKRLCYQRLQRPNCADRPILRRALRRLKQRKAPAELCADGEVRPAIETVRLLQGERESAGNEYDHALRRDERILHAQFRELAADNRFREAVAWQNRHALVTGIDFLRRVPPDAPANAPSRTRELLVARYLQRYAAKNDTIGFFGPVAWSVISDLAGGLRFRPGKSLAVDPVVEFEPWAMRVLARKISEDPELRPWLAPRRHPAARREADGVVAHLERRVRLPPREAHAFDACDGVTVARDIAARLAVETAGLFPAQADVLDTLNALVAGGLIYWGVAVPPVTAADAWLRGVLERLPPEAPQRGHVATLDGLVALKAAPRRAWGDGDAVATAIARLEERFRGVTGAAPTHLPGQLYAGRTLLYVDARRDAECEIGETLVLELGRALRPVLEAARWYSRQFYVQFLDFADGVYEERRRAGGHDAVAFDSVWLEMRRRLATVEAIRDDVLEQLVERWSELMPLPQGERAVHYSSDALIPRLAAAFDDAPAGWPGARFQSPDVMLAADSVEAVAGGRYAFVLGELHAASRNLLQEVFLGMHPGAANLMEAARREQPEPQLRVAMRGDAVITRAGKPPDPGVEFDIECDETLASLPRERVIALSELLIQRGPRGLVLRTRDGRHAFPAAAFFGPQGSAYARHRFSPFPGAAHTPRVTIDRLVIHRESWRVRLEDLGFARAATRSDRYLGARRWARALDLPRRSFYRVPGEPKPVYLDLDSPVYVDLLAKLVRAASAAQGGEISITEMLPGPGDAWLPDAHGNRYTSEFRLLFVDRSDLAPDA